MENPKICPACGAPQQWKMWTRCACGHDFVSSEKLAPKRESEIGGAATKEGRFSTARGADKAPLLESPPECGADSPHRPGPERGPSLILRVLFLTAIILAGLVCLILAFLYHYCSGPMNL